MAAVVLAGLGLQMRKELSTSATQGTAMSLLRSRVGASKRGHLRPPPAMVTTGLPVAKQRRFLSPLLLSLLNIMVAVVASGSFSNCTLSFLLTCIIADGGTVVDL